MLVDLILSAVIGGAFYAGFRAGAQYRSFTALIEALKAKLK